MGVKKSDHINTMQQVVEMTPRLEGIPENDSINYLGPFPSQGSSVSSTGPVGNTMYGKPSDVPRVNNGSFMANSSILR